jgi:hypothetical protein
MKKQRRKERKQMERFFRDHCFNGYWYKPMKLKKIMWDAHGDKEIIDKLIEIRNACIEAGRLRMVARGLVQYATKEELEQYTQEQRIEYENRTGFKFEDLITRK